MSEIDFGILIRTQYEAQDDMSVRFDEICEQARAADRLGFASIVKGSHFGGAPLQDIQQIPFLSRMSAEAPNVRLVAGIVLLSLHKPIDIAEQIASLDVMSKGKAVFGCGLGYREVEFKAFGTTQKARVKRFEENLEAIKRLWAEESVTMQGSHFELDNASLGIRPLQKPRPPIWIGANANPGIRRAARLGDCWYIPAHNRVDTILEQLGIYHAELEKQGRELPAEQPIRREIFVAPTREEAYRRAAPSLALKYKTYHDWGQDKAMPKGDDNLGQEDFDELAKDRFFIGTPDEVSEKLIDFCKPTGANHIIVSLHWPGMELNVTLDAMQLFAEEVMPSVRQGLG